MDCPICKREMVQRRTAGVALDACEQHGVWLDHQELFLITERLRHEEGSFTLGDLVRRPKRPAFDPNRQLGCPVCTQPMRLEHYQKVALDWCPGHGVWLDAGELEAILNNLRLDPIFLRGVALRLGELRY